MLLGEFDHFRGQFGAAPIVIAVYHGSDFIDLLHQFLMVAIQNFAFHFK
jgi:hypothetical protein